jgi:hypothetical protein
MVEKSGVERFGVEKSGLKCPSTYVVTSEALH